jgi:hypothetical protein
VIGGNDIVFPAVGDSASLEACARIVGRHWPDIRFEDAITGEKYQRIGEIPLGRVQELLAYPDAESEAGWDFDRPDSEENSMLCLIVRPDEITVVIDNPKTVQMQSILKEIHDWLWTDITWNHLRPAA